MSPVASLLASVLLASTIVAVPSSHLPRSLGGRQPRYNNRPQHVSSVVLPPDPIWAGAIQSKANGTFSSVTGTFTLPTLSGANGSSAAAWVGIDGYDCNNSLLQTGLDMSVVNGTIEYDAWYEWYPRRSVTFGNITLSAGDDVRLTVTAYSTTSGYAEIENMTNGQKVSSNVTSSNALCQQSAEWIVEDYQSHSGLVPFVDFGTVTFTDATAVTPNGALTPDGADIANIEQNNRTLTSVSIHEGNVIIKYV